MVSRIIQVDIKPERLHDLRQALDSTVIPNLKQQPGFVDAVESSDPNTGRFVCLTLWKSREDADRYGNTAFLEHAQMLTPLCASEPSVQTLEVETSTVHNIAATKAA